MNEVSCGSGFHYRIMRSRMGAEICAKNFYAVANSLIEEHQMNDSNIFWKLLREYADNYGATTIALTITSSLLIGYALHYIMNIFSLKRKLIMNALEKDKPSDNQKDEAKEVVNVELETDDRKQVGIGRGMINGDLVSSLRKVPNECNRIVPVDTIAADNRRTLPIKQMTGITNSDDEESENVINVQSRGKQRSASLQENISFTDEHLFNTLGKLHGKLATAHLRARTRRIQEDMTSEQRDNEARARAEQLESIMKLIKQNQEKFGLTNEDDINEQLNMYNF